MVSAAHPASPPRTTPSLPSPLLRARTHGRRTITDGTRTGAVTRVRRDVYIEADSLQPGWLAAATRHQALLEAIRADGVDGVVVLESAALLHGAVTWRLPATVHLSVGYRTNGLRLPAGRTAPDQPTAGDLSPADRRKARRERPLTRHQLAVASADVIDIGGLRTTRIERTIEDCARFLEPDAALVVVDSLLAVATGAMGPNGVVHEPGAALDRPWDRAAQINADASALRSAVLARLERRAGERGVRRARAVLHAASPWSQSPFETEARRLCLVFGIEPPTPQLPVATPTTTRFLDLGWARLRLGVEIDGAVKEVGGSKAELEARAGRDEELDKAGFTLLHVDPATVRDGLWMVQRLRNFLPVTATEARPVTDLRTRIERRRGRA